MRHSDIMDFNVMVDPIPLYSELPHFVKKGKSYDFKRRISRFTRTERPVKYYYIDFGISRRYGADEASPLEDSIVGGDKSVPEFEGTDEPQNPFWTDIYYLGNLIRTDFLQVCPHSCDAILSFVLLTMSHSQGAHGFEFMQLLIDDMVQKDPTKRPTIGQARSRFESLRESLSERKLRSRVVYRDEFAVFRSFRYLKHCLRTAVRVSQGVPALPTP